MLFILQDLDDPSFTSDDHETLLTREEDVKEGKVKVLLASPESILKQHRKLIEDLASQKIISAIAVDEAHCVLKYGYSRKTKSGKKIKAFRKEYSRITEVRAILGHVPLLALTATLTAEAQTKLIKELNMSPCFNIILPPNKDNIKYIVHRLPKDSQIEDHFHWLLKAIAKEGDKMKKTVVFFHKISRQGDAYEYLDYELQDQGHYRAAPFNM
jgi:superfamily II DNA helicase RecQ